MAVALSAEKPLEKRIHRSGRTLARRQIPYAARRKNAILEAGINKNASCHTFLHFFATHLPESDYNIRTIQEHLGHSDMSTTMIYTHVLNRGSGGVVSPLERM